MKITLRAKDPSVSVPSSTFFTPILPKEVIANIPNQAIHSVSSQSLNHPSKPMNTLLTRHQRKLLKELQSIQQTFLFPLKLTITSPRPLYAFTLPFLDTSPLPPEFVTLAYQVIAGLMVAILLVGIMMSILVSGYHLVNKSEKAEAWQKAIRRGILQGLTAPFILMCLAYLVHYFLLGKAGYIPIFKNTP